MDGNSGPSRSDSSQPPLSLLARAIEATLEELVEIRDSLIQELPSLEGYYVNVLYAYLSGDLPVLKKLSKTAPPGREPDQVRAVFQRLALLRWEIRKQKVTDRSIQMLQDFLSKPALLDEIRDADPSIVPEIHFVLAMAEETAERPEKASSLYHLASVGFRKLGIGKKSVKASLNRVVAESQVHTEQSFITEYHFIYRRARAVGQNSVAAVALLNISREYQKLSAYRISLKYANRALALHQGDARTLPYYLILVHRCHLHCQLKRWDEAWMDYEQCSVAPFPEVQSALSVIESFKPRFESEVRKSGARAQSQALLPTWKERKAEGVIHAPELGPIEQRLLSLVSIKPRDKFELIEKIYGKNVPFHQAENRLKNLLNRIRRKHPDLIEFRQGSYGIASQSAPELGFDFDPGG